MRELQAGLHVAEAFHFELGESAAFFHFAGCHLRCQQMRLCLAWSRNAPMMSLFLQKVNFGELTYEILVHIDLLVVRALLAIKRVETTLNHLVHFIALYASFAVGEYATV